MSNASRSHAMGPPVRPGSKPQAITVAIKDIDGVLRATARIIPYPAKQGGFAVSIPLKPFPPTEIALVDVTRAITSEAPGAQSRSGFLSASALHRSEVLDKPIKLSFHPSGFVQFSPAGANRFLAGMKRDPIMAAKGYGMFWDPAEGMSPAGPTFGVGSYALSSYPEAVDDGRRPVEVFRRAPGTEDAMRRIQLANEHADWIGEADSQDHGGETHYVEGYVFRRSTIAEAEPSGGGRLHLHFRPSHWDSVRHMRVLDWGDPNWILGLHVTRRTFGQTAMGFSIAGPIDRTGLLQLVAVSPPLVR